MKIPATPAAAIAPFLLALALPISSTSAQPSSPREPAPPPASPANLSLRNEVQHAIAKGLDWLAKNQASDGSWSTPDHPAVTALALVAFQGESPAAESNPRSESMRKGYDYLLRCVKPDGSIHGKKELLNYNTSVSMMALLAAKNPAYNPIILKARQFIVGLQSDFGEPGKLDTPLDGGIGYGSRYPHSDMSNTLLALEALYHSKHLVQDQAPSDVKQLNWAAALHFIQSCQNLPSHNKESWVSGDPRNKGGFIYFPGHSMAGETNLAPGRVALRSYGSISYAGLLSYIYADLEQDDPRVQAVLNWLQSNFTLEENPGMGPQGLFYYFHTMAKALNLAGIEIIQTQDGKQIPWRKELALRLMNLQATDGSWANQNARWWEKDPALVTSYALITLEIIRNGL